LRFVEEQQVSAWSLCAYRVGSKVLRDEQKSTMAVLLMCISPASVFLTMAYTESLFQMLTNMGVWLLVNCDTPLLAALPFALSCAVRSNGEAFSS
jgi:Gpi18-like mannosyltransferase